MTCREVCEQELRNQIGDKVKNLVAKPNIAAGVQYVQWVTLQEVGQMIKNDTPERKKIIEKMIDDLIKKAEEL